MSRGLFLISTLFSIILTSCGGKNPEPVDTSYTVTFNGNGGTLVSGKEVQTVYKPSEIMEPTYERDNYNFTGWDKNISSITYSTTISAQWSYSPSEDISIEIDGFTKKENNLRGTADYESNMFSFNNKVHVHKTSSWKLYADIGGSQEIPTKTIPLDLGDNVVYILVTAASGNTGFYTVTVRRLNMFTITFDSDGGTPVDQIQAQEESILEDVPTTTKEGYTFGGWSYDFNKPILSNVNTKASWSKNYYNVNIVNSDSSKGTVKGEGRYLFNTKITIMATPLSGYKFIGWFVNDKKISESQSYQFNVPSYDVTYTANWSSLIKPTLTINEYNDEWGETTGGGDYIYNEQVTVTATPNSGCRFDGWYSGGSRLSKDLSYTFLMPENGIVISALFGIKNQYFTYKITDNNTLTVDSCTFSDQSVIIPKYDVYQNRIYNVTSIGDEAFAECTSLVSIAIPDCIQSIGKYAFSSCTALSTLVIPDSVTTISASAFYGCYSLTSVSISNKITAIESNVFSCCSKISSITIPNSVTSIGYNAFNRCSSLGSITIPNSVTSIGINAFYENSSLTDFDLTNLDHVIEIPNNGIFSSSYVPMIKVTKKMLTAYKEDTNWQKYKNKITTVEI